MAQAKLQLLRKELNEAFLERGQVIDGLLASLLAGGNAVLYGPPGTAKSDLLKGLCSSISGAVYFKRLLQKAMPPEELLGPISLKSLEKDELKRNTAHRLPEAHIAFLDEVFKCNATTLNALLGILNEREFENPIPQQVPLQFLCGAANRVPEEPELAPFVDRFIFRPWIPYLRSDKNKAALIGWSCDGNRPSITPDQLSLSELEKMKAEAVRLPVSNDMRADYLAAIRYLGEEGFEISDRRIMQLLKLLKCFAYVQGDQFVCIEHLHGLLPYCLWTKEASEISSIKNALSTICPLPRKNLSQLLDTAKKETNSALLAEDQQIAIERAVTQLVNTQRLIEKLEAGQKTNLEPKKFKQALEQLAEYRKELAEAQDYATY